MYKVIVVDDEPLIREGITDYINCTSQDFLVVQHFSNAKSALEYVKNNPIDVVITDIKMPTMTGIEFSEILYNEFSEIFVVVISGYKEFEYAHKVMQLNIKHYLLKPLDLEEVDRTLDYIREKIKDKEAEEHQKEVYNEINENLIEEYVFDCISGAKKDRDRIADTITRLSIAPNAEDYPCCIINVDYSKCIKYINENWSYGKENFTNVLVNVLKNSVSEINFYKFFQDRENLKLFAICKNRVETSEFERIIRGCFIDSNKVFKEMKNLFVDYELLKVFDNFISILDVKKSNYIDLSKDYPLEISKGILSHITDKDYDGAYNLFMSFFESRGDIPIEYAHGFMLNIINGIFSNSEYEVFKDKYTSSLVLKKESVLELISLFEAIIEDLRKLNYGNDDKQNIIMRAKEFILTHHNTDISLADVAGAVFLSPAYFSRFFRENIGESFTDYLVKIRMDHAIVLLRDKQKINDISNAVGYRTSRYFVHAFKQYTGLTPKEYYRKVTDLRSEE